MQRLEECLELAVTPDIAMRVLSDIRTVFCLSPVRSLREFRKLSSGDDPCSRFEAVTECYADGSRDTLFAEMAVSEGTGEVRVDIKSRDLSGMEFAVRSVPHGCSMTQTLLVSCEDQASLDAYREELRFWVRSIAAYIALTAGRGIRKNVMKWFMDRIWLKLNLRERKIALILMAFSAAELVLLLFMAVLWRIFGS